MSHLVSPGRVRIAAALLLTSPYVPMLFAGEEWAAGTPFRYFTGHESADLAEAVRRGRREEFAAFGWDPDDVPDPQDPATFEASRLRWDERGGGEHADVLAWHRDLVALRHETDALRDADRAAVAVDHEPHAGWLVVRRGPIQVAANLGGKPVELAVDGRIRLAWPPDLAVESGSVRLPPDGVVVAEHGR